MSGDTSGRAPGSEIIVALDRPGTDENLRVIRALDGRAAWFKVGMRQFYAGGDDVIGAVRDAGAKLFLDLKLHDIPHTVGTAIRSLDRYAPELLTIHASGGAAMVGAAREAADAAGAVTQLLAVTVLTSLDESDLKAMGMQGDAEESVLRLGGLALASGAQGLVCSPREVAALRALHSEAILVTPGIRPAGSAMGDQKRAATPAAALKAGSSLLVIGRPIHGADDPAAAFDAIAESLPSSTGG